VEKKIGLLNKSQVTNTTSSGGCVPTQPASYV